MVSMDILQAKKLTALVAALTLCRDDLRAAALCGSWARGNPRVDSDIDFLIVARDAEILRRNQRWIRELKFPIAGFQYTEHKSATYGVAWSAHIILEPAAAIELTFANPSWASVDPVDPGTGQIVADAFKVLIDKDGHLQRLCTACS